MRATRYRRASLFAVAAALVGAGACGTSKPMDSGLKQDLAAAGANGLELAPTSARSQVVVSAIEGGPTFAPTVRKAVPKPVPRPLAHVTAVAATAPQTIPQTTAAPTEATTEPAPLPPAARPTQERQKGTYKTEAEIFRQMPWIKP